MLRLYEIIVFVENMQTQVAFYRDVLGLKLNHPQALEDYSAENWVTFGAGGCVLALHAGRRPGNGDEPIRSKYVFKVEELESHRSRLQAAGAEVSEIHERGRAGRRGFRLP